jgi:hypothetical protein
MTELFCEWIKEGDEVATVGLSLGVTSTIRKIGSSPGNAASGYLTNPRMLHLGTALLSDTPTLAVLPEDLDGDTVSP